MSMSQNRSSTTASSVISTRTPQADQLPLMATLLVYYIMLDENFAMPDILVFRRNGWSRQVLYSLASNEENISQTASLSIFRRDLLSFSLN